MRETDRIGEVSKNNFGSLMEIVEYKKSIDICVEFLEHDYKVKTTYQNFKNGKVKNPYDKSIYKIGYIGEGDYKTWENGKASLQYSTWFDMLKRCYSERFQEKHKSYIGCTVCDDWHNFQNFAEWFEGNYYTLDGERMELDKDILVKGNKIYSSDTCIFVPQRINLLLVRNVTTRGDLPLGVNFDKASKKYAANCSDSYGKKVRLGFFNTPEEAFQMYKTFKEKIIKKVAEEYRNKIPEKLYDTLITYKVKIDD